MRQSCLLFMLQLTEKTRVCSKCHTKKPLNENFFAKNQSTNTGGAKYFRPECKQCSSKERSGCNKAKKRAGNPERPPLGTPCDNCGRTDRKLVFDHCHVTLKHRGWLCDNLETRPKQKKSLIPANFFVSFSFLFFLCD